MKEITSKTICPSCLSLSEYKGPAGKVGEMLDKFFLLEGIQDIGQRIELKKVVAAALYLEAEGQEDALTSSNDISKLLN